MTYTQDSESGIAGLNVVLKSSAAPRKLQPLASWMAAFDPAPTWVPLSKNHGVTRIMAVLPQPQPYSDLMQTICHQIGLSPTIEWQGHPYDLTGVEVDSSSLHVVQVPITTTEQLPPTVGRAIHALCLRWFSLANELLGTQLHQAENLPLSLVMKSVSARQLYLRIGLLQKSLLAPLLWGLAQDLGTELTLTDIPCRIGHGVDILQSSTYEALAQLPLQSTIDLQFLTPTSFKQGKVIQPFPLPELVFNSLLRRWNAFAPLDLQFPSIEWRGVTAAYELKTYALKMKGGAEIGAQGMVRYQFADPTQAQIATTLAQFARFAGVGRKTAMGMGQTKVHKESR
ncbi:CRISPR system precrRNA processing endoribonuclease RAMP protein Cas6 [Pantanalinema rosaneae CENA516]|uniref:CRISPR system precrRNA processing endoribonuclease RAMP protein Cas6 n=1 Tax=Pantanalinema rosaneae TaxID=1620701 RepID=UPI003D6F6F54